jgi:hypothetical protein
MASKRRIRRKQCSGKIRYENETVAKSSAFLISSRSGSLLRQYKCRWCHQYHIGHPPGKLNRVFL